MESTLRSLAQRWAGAGAAERANAQLYLSELCDALEVERPRPAGTGYAFEYPVKVVNRDGSETTNFIDLFKAGFFVLEAKDQERGRPDELLMRRAFGQARSYAAAVEGAPPPYLMVLDVGKTLMVWDRWSGSYGGFNAGRRINLASISERPEDIALLRHVWEDPDALNPRARAAAVTREIAGQLAELAAALQGRGHDAEAVARFLIRCVFTAFAEDVGLLQDRPFETAIREVGFTDPADFAVALEGLWAAMDQGKRFGLRRLLRFNGHFFHDATALPLTREDLAVLLRASQADWSTVEPSIFGTLLVRALDPEERHRLGAEYTPPEFIERLIRPTVEEPIRERWTGVQAEVLQLTDREGKSERKQREDRRAALDRLREFHTWLRGLRFLDPACGSGNFLYLTMHLVKRIELEVLRSIEEVTGSPELAVEEVGPWQFHGIEVKPWARELAELVLWIGYHQWWRQIHGHTQPPEPVLRDTGTLELRDAVLAWDEIVHVPERDRPDPTPRIPHPVTGKLVPDPAARLPYLEYRGARQAEWPRADFIVGNPPYLGNKRMREAFGDGYVDALRGVYPEVPDSADFVMYWWHRAANEVVEDGTVRAGLITTNSITQTFNRSVVQRATDRGLGIAWAVPDHPWVDDAGGAAVRVALTVLEKQPATATWIKVNDAAQVVQEVRVPRLNTDLSPYADVAGAALVPLHANVGLSSRGFTLVGRGFVVESREAEQLRAIEPLHCELIRPYLNGKDLTTRPRGFYVVDFGTRTEAEAGKYPVLYDLIRSRVKSAREANNDRSTRENWWRFGRNRENFRTAVGGLPRYIATPYVAKHHFFTFLDASVAPDEKLVVVASDSSFDLGVLSSAIHSAWALAAGTRLGVGNDPTYNNSLTFDPYPFPDPPRVQRDAIADVAETLDRHRKDALARDERVTITGMYNVVEKLRPRASLTAKEREIHELGACGVLKDLHDALDRLVATAYGWPWPLEREEILSRLVELHAQRVEEERRGSVRWLRPGYQIPLFGGGVRARIPDRGAVAPGYGTESRQPEPWPAAAWEQVRALQDRLARAPVTIEEAAAAFRGARRDLVQRHLETLAVMGEVRVDEEGAYHLLPKAA